MPQIKIPRRNHLGCMTCTSGMPCEPKIFFLQDMHLIFFYFDLTCPSLSNLSTHFDITLSLMYWWSRHCSRWWEFQHIPLIHITLKLKNSWETAETTCLSMLDQRAYAISWHCSLSPKSSTIFYWQQTGYLLLLYY